ncbi:MAG TPA: hypothetical protein VER17_19055 [Tepidisphaeraceae bacterium]|nr:hypothetical protein [Tepidisphaeraceae bacterium]
MFDLIQIIYWLALSTWFGGVLFVAIAAPLIMRATRDSHLVLTNVLSVNLEGQHGTLLGGAIVGRIMSVVHRVELACAAALLVATIGQWIVLRPGGALLMPPIARAGLYLGAVALLVYEWRVAWPRMWRNRQEYVDHADEPDVANPALDRLNVDQSETAMVLAFRVALLLGMILFSAGIRQTNTILIPA